MPPILYYSMNLQGTSNVTLVSFVDHYEPIDATSIILSQVAPSACSESSLQAWFLESYI